MACATPLPAAQEIIKCLDENIKCVVCLEYYEEPRNLRCGHVFCSKCLQSILAEQTNSTIPCPTCREETTLQYYEDISSLPRPVLLTDIKENVLQLLKSPETFLVPVAPQPLSDLTLINCVDPGACVSGLAMDVKRQVLVIRTMDRNEPIKIYSYPSCIKQDIGLIRKGIVNSGYGGIAVDTKRDLYVLPSQTDLKVMDTKGVFQYSLRIGRDLRGVAYCEANDSYVLTDVDDRRVYIVDAETKQVTTKFGSLGKEDNEFSEPFNVCVGKITAKGDPVVIVSDCWNHSLKVYSMGGKHIKTIGVKGREEGQMQCAVGVAIDPAGHVIVCDHDNRRVVACRLDRDKDQWRCLLDRDQCGGKPFNVAVDREGRILALDVRGEIRLYQEQTPSCSGYDGSVPTTPHVKTMSGCHSGKELTKEVDKPLKKE